MKLKNLTAIISERSKQLLINSGADFGLDGFVGTVPHAANMRLKEILKRRALFGNQTVVLLTNSCGNTNSGASNPFFLKLL